MTGMSAAFTHLLTGLIWGIYAVTVGSLAIVYNFGSPWVFVSIITAVVGNSAHLVSFAWSTAQGLKVSAQKAG